MEIKLISEYDTCLDFWRGSTFPEIFSEICPTGGEREISGNITCLGAGAPPDPLKSQAKHHFL